MATEVDELIDWIDNRGLEWDVYRTHDRRWMVRIKDGYWAEYSNPSLWAALKWANEVVFLPLVPPRPRIRSYEIRRASSNNWQIFSGGYARWATKTRKAAQESIATMEQRERDEFNQWQQRFGQLVQTGEPGVDFWWADHSGRPITEERRQP